MLRIVMATVKNKLPLGGSTRKINAKPPRPPRAKSTNASPSNTQTRTFKTATTTTAGGKPKASLPRVNSESSLNDRLKNLSINDRTQSKNKSNSKSSTTRKYSTNAVTCHNLEDVARYITSKRAKNIVVMAGAGISTPSGIPDFRTPGTGLYDNLKKYSIPYPEAIFDIDYFHRNPRPFFELAKELYPGKYQPNYVHYFVRMLYEKGLLLRMYTQNIDGLEGLAGIPPEKIVSAHGSFLTASCVQCSFPHKGEEIRDTIYAGKLPKCKRRGCMGIVKPDIVFFGEDLPKRFYYYLKDFPLADLLIVMGTSLEVEPFAGIVDSTRMYVPRLLFNMKAVGPFAKRKRMNDVIAEGDLVGNVKRFAKILGWKTSMEQLVQESQKQVQDPLPNSKAPPLNLQKNQAIEMKIKPAITEDDPVKTNDNPATSKPGAVVNNGEAVIKGANTCTIENHNRSKQSPSPSSDKSKNSSFAGLSRPKQNYHTFSANSSMTVNPSHSSIRTLPSPKKTTPPPRVGISHGGIGYRGTRKVVESSSDDDTSDDESSDSTG
ncbi:unnamed protein product [Owenia fusiformis]|uniref:Uncharacterized protein n=1 Tax=Owenia fusiformis TaxID=6347 RepID=A0A8J1XTD0_OWEFU|nr:unnamed protein product [Owenia fusiformis]